MSKLKRRLMRLPEVEDSIGYKKSKIYQMIDKGEFPAPVKLGSRSRAWKEEEVQEWIDERPRV